MDENLGKQVREKLKMFRNEKGLTLSEAGNRVGISGQLWSILEEGGVTQESFARKIGRLCGLCYLEVEELLPSHRRKNGGDYEPTRFVAPCDSRPTDVARKVPKSIIEEYEDSKHPTRRNDYVNN